MAFVKVTLTPAKDGERDTTVIAVWSSRPRAPSPPPRLCRRDASLPVHCTREPPEIRCGVPDEGARGGRRGRGVAEARHHQQGGESPHSLPSPSAGARSRNGPPWVHASRAIAAQPAVEGGARGGGEGPYRGGERGGGGAGEAACGDGPPSRRPWRSSSRRERALPAR